MDGLGASVSSPEMLLAGCPYAILKMVLHFLFFSPFLASSTRRSSARLAPGDRAQSLKNSKLESKKALPVMHALLKFSRLSPLRRFGFLRWIHRSTIFLSQVSISSTVG